MKSSWIRRGLVAASLVAAVCAAVPASASLYAVSWETGDFYTVNSSTAALSMVGNLGFNQPGEIEYNQADGKMYAISAGTPNLYTVNTASGAATLVGSTGLGFMFEGGLAFGGGKAYAGNAGSNTPDQLVTLDLATGAATLLGGLAGSHDLNGLAYRSDGKLVALDDNTNSLLVIDPTDMSYTTLAAIDPTVGSLGGMTVDGGQAYFCTGLASGNDFNRGAGSNSLYTFDMFTGSYSLVGSFGTTGGGHSISGIAGTASAVPGVPEPGTWMMMGIGALGLAALRRKA